MTARATARALPGFSFSATKPQPPKLAAAPHGGVSITLRGLKKAFGDKPVLRGIDLDIPAGQFIAVVGRSGCGKSTLLRTIVGLEQASAGVVAAGKADEARIMFQEPRLLPWARVVDNVRVGVRGLDKAAGRKAARAALAEVGLEDRAGEWPSVLSGGQKQRVALARALVSRPRILAFDEPLGALDALTRIEMQALLERVWREQSFTAVLVTHDVAEALALADRVVLIENGEIALDLTVDLPRPRRRGSPEIAKLEGAILDQLFGNGGPAEARFSDDRPAENRKEHVA